MQYVTIDGKEYPFKFGIREILTFSQKNNLEFDEVEQAVMVNFDLLLELYEMASKKGARRNGSDLVIDPVTLEETIDDNPQVFMDLQDAFQNSAAYKFLSEQGEQAGNPKKPNG